MPNQNVEQSVEFTAEAQRALDERTKAFAEELRLAAIEEAIRRRGSASEVNASDVLRAAAAALEEESLKAYEKKIDTLAKILQEQTLRSQANASQLANLLTSRLEHLAGAVGVNKERERELQILYQKLQEQSYASAAEMRNMLAHEIKSIRGTLAEAVEATESKIRPTRPAAIERLSWLYVFVGLIATAASLIGAVAPLILRNLAPSVRAFALVGLCGLVTAMFGAGLLAYRRLRRPTGPPRFFGPGH